MGSIEEAVFKCASFYSDQDPANEDAKWVRDQAAAIMEARGE